MTSSSTRKPFKSTSSHPLCKIKDVLLTIITTASGAHYCLRKFYSLPTHSSTIKINIYHDTSFSVKLDSDGEIVPVEGKAALEVRIKIKKNDPIIFKTSGGSAKVPSLRKCSDDAESTVMSGSETGAGNKGDTPLPASSHTPLPMPLPALATRSHEQQTEKNKPNADSS